MVAHVHRTRAAAYQWPVGAGSGRSRSASAMACREVTRRTSSSAAAARIAVAAPIVVSMADRSARSPAPAFARAACSASSASWNGPARCPLASIKENVVTSSCAAACTSPGKVAARTAPIAVAAASAPSRWPVCAARMLCIAAIEMSTWARIGLPAGSPIQTVCRSLSAMPMSSGRRLCRALVAASMARRRSPPLSSHTLGLRSIMDLTASSSGGTTPSISCSSTDMSRSRGIWSSSSAGSWP